MRRLVVTLSVAAALVLAGCTALTSGGDEPRPIAESVEESAADSVLDVASGEPLSEYLGTPSYPYRLAMAQNKGAFTRALTRASPSFTDDFFDEALDTCLSAEASDWNLDWDRAYARWTSDLQSTGAGMPLDSEFREAVRATRRYVCPEMRLWQRHPINGAS